MAFTTSGQETEWAYSYSPGAREQCQQCRLRGVNQNVILRRSWQLLTVSNSVVESAVFSCVSARRYRRTLLPP